MQLRADIEGQLFFGFSYCLPFVQVVEYQGRWFVRHGHHRAFALLSRAQNVKSMLKAILRNDSKAVN